MEFVHISTDCPEFAYMLPWKLYNRIKGMEDFWCLGAYRGSRILGCVIFTRMAVEDSLKLEFIYVEPRYRRLGIGTDLLNAAKAKLKDAGAKRLYCTLDDEKTMEERQVFLDRSGFIESAPAGLLVEMSLEQITHSELMDVVRKNTLLLDSVTSFKEQDATELNHICNRITREGLTVDAAFLDMDTCHLYRDEEGRVGALVGKRSDRRTVSVWKTTSFSKKPQWSVLGSLWLSTARDLEESMPPESYICFMGLDDNAKNLLEDNFGQAVRVSSVRELVNEIETGV